MGEIIDNEDLNTYIEDLEKCNEDHDLAEDLAKWLDSDEDYFINPANQIKSSLIRFAYLTKMTEISRNMLHQLQQKSKCSIESRKLLSCDKQNYSSRRFSSLRLRKDENTKAKVARMA